MCERERVREIKREKKKERKKERESDSVLEQFQWQLELDGEIVCPRWHGNPVQ